MKKGTKGGRVEAGFSDLAKVPGVRMVKKAR